MSRLVHFAHAIREDGAVLPTCRVLSLLGRRPRVINLRYATWTNRREAVTCKACIAKLERLERLNAERNPAPGSER